MTPKLIHGAVIEDNGRIRGVTLEGQYIYTTPIARSQWHADGVLVTTRSGSVYLLVGDWSALDAYCRPLRAL